MIKKWDKFKAIDCLKCLDTTQWLILLVKSLCLKFLQLLLNELQLFQEFFLFVHESFYLLFLVPITCFTLGQMVILLFTQLQINGIIKHAFLVSYFLSLIQGLPNFVLMMLNRVLWWSWSWSLKLLFFIRLLD